MTGYSDSIMD
jgi:hypothetical protein